MNAKWALCCIAVVAFGYFVYPTPYEYTRQFPVVNRVNRFSGVLETSTEVGWMTREDQVKRALKNAEDISAKSTAAQREQLAQDQSAVDKLQASDSGDGTKVNVYNPTDTLILVDTFIVEYLTDDKKHLFSESPKSLVARQMAFEAKKDSVIDVPFSDQFWDAYEKVGKGQIVRTITLKSTQGASRIIQSKIFSSNEMANRSKAYYNR